MVSNTGAVLGERTRCAGTAPAKGMLVEQLEARLPATVHQSVVVIHSSGGICGNLNLNVNMQPRPAGTLMPPLSPLSPPVVAPEEERETVTAVLQGPNDTTSNNSKTNSTGDSYVSAAGHSSSTSGILTKLAALKSSATVLTTPINLPPSPPGTTTMPTPTSPLAQDDILPDPLLLLHPPPLHPAWLAAEALLPPRIPMSIPERQPLYAAEQRALHAKLTSPGALFETFGNDINETWFRILAPDGWSIPIARYTRGTPSTPPQAPFSWTDSAFPLPHPQDPIPTSSEEKLIIIYLHGGGLAVGEADSEALTLRRILHTPNLPRTAIFSIGYRLMPQYPASTCVSDALAAFVAIRSAYASLPTPPKLVLIGSSSGGQLAAHVSQLAPPSTLGLAGVLLRCPVTSDAFSGLAYVPPRFAHLHTSATNPAFATSLLKPMIRTVPRDGLERMPLEADEAERARAGEVGRTWVQVCTNDMLYGDGVAYARMVEGEVGNERVRVDVVRGWPHTFWLKTPEVEGAVEAEEGLVGGLRWVLGEGE